MKDTLIDIRKLSWRYPQSRSPLFTNFSFSFGSNDFCIVQGVSGCGKTTLVKMLTGYIMPPRKSIFFASEDISRFGNYERQLYRRSIGAVFQENKLLDDMNVQDNICYPLRLYGFEEDVISSSYETVIEQVGLKHKSNHAIRLLSGGEKQKVAIARALIHQPSLVIADEPTGNLDRKSSTKIADLFVGINATGTGVLFITHNTRLVEYISSSCPVSYQYM